MNSEKKKRVFVENVKTEHTTHWDLDYLSLAELEALYDKKNRSDRAADRKATWFPRRSTLVAVLAASTAALLAVLLVLMWS